MNKPSLKEVQDIIDELQNYRLTQLGSNYTLEMKIQTSKGVQWVPLPTGVFSDASTLK